MKSITAAKEFSNDLKNMKAIAKAGGKAMQEANKQTGFSQDVTKRGAKALGQLASAANQEMNSFKIMRDEDGGLTEEAMRNVMQRRLNPDTLVRDYVCDKILTGIAISLACVLIIPLIVICALASDGEVLTWEQVTVPAAILGSLAGLLVLAICVNVLIFNNPIFQMFECFQEVRKERRDIVELGPMARPVPDPSNADVAIDVKTNGL